MASTATTEFEVSLADVVESTTLQLAPSEHVPTSSSAASTSPSSIVLLYDVCEASAASVSVKPARF